MAARGRQTFHGAAEHWQSSLRQSVRRLSQSHTFTHSLTHSLTRRRSTAPQPAPSHTPTRPTNATYIPGWMDMYGGPTEIDLGHPSMHACTTSVMWSAVGRAEMAAWVETR